LIGVNRTTFYYRPLERPACLEELAIMAAIDEEYTSHPFYGARRMRVHLTRKGYRISRWRVTQLMAKMGLEAIGPKPDTSRPAPGHKVYPYLLRNFAITRPNQVWSTDITYIRLTHGFAYLVAIIDWYSRKVLAWRVSNTIDTSFCIDCLEDALAQGTPEIFNTDQGSQFTSAAFTGVLEKAGVRISMDGRGRALDNIFVERLWRSVKYEDVYPNGYQRLFDLAVGLGKYFLFYNEERPHQSLGYAVPASVHAA
jgi:putative transposase